MKLYIVSIREPIEDLEKQIDGLPPARREKTKSFKKKDDKLRSLYAGVFMRKYCGCEDENGIMYNPNGKPFTTAGLKFNVSHGGDFVILGTSDHSVGVDIEPIGGFDIAVARSVLQPNELDWVIDDPTRLYVLWTRKESIMKASGRGFSLPPESFNVLPVDAPFLSVDGMEYGIHSRVYDGHSISVAILGQSADFQIVKLSPNYLLNYDLA